MLFGNTGLSLILLLACLALLIVLLRIWRAKRATHKLERDASGLWRYHRETLLQRKMAYGVRLEDKRRPREVDTVAVLRFDGDIRARQHRSFAHLVDEIAVNNEALSEVVVILSSPGGMVAPYGHAFSQMERIRNLGVRLTICVDVVAASGGYLMAVPAHKILAAPLAVVGSSGGMAFVPNVRKFLLNKDIVPRTFTAGKFKRTVSLTDEAQPEEIAHFQEQLESIHAQFVSAVGKYREGADVKRVGTGEHWTAEESVRLGLGLVDEISTSEQYLLDKNRDSDLVVFEQRRSLFDDGLGKFTSRLCDVVEERLSSSASGGLY